MKRLKRSFGHALHGLWDAFARERNLQMFAVGLLPLACIGLVLEFDTAEWRAIVICCGFFLSTELMNTALERLSDVLDGERKLLGRHEYHEGIRLTKDIAASASLISLCTLGIITLAAAVPHLMQ